MIYISAFTGNGQYTYITFGTDVFFIRKAFENEQNPKWNVSFECFVLK